MKGLLITQGLIIIALGFYLIIIKRKLGENLQSNKQDYETIFNNTQDAIFLIDVVGDSFKYRRLNPVHEELSGFSSEEIKGKGPQDLFNKPLAKRLIANYQRCKKEKRTINYTEKIVLAAGEKTWHTKLSPVLNSQDEVVQIIGSLRDITRNNEIEKSLKESQRKYKQLFDEAPIGLIKCDRDGNLLNVNKRLLSILGSPGKGMTMSLNVLELPGIEKFKKGIERSVQENKVISGEDKYQSYWGKKLWIEYIIKPLVDSNNEVREIIVSFSDITRRKKYEKEMKYLSFHDQLTGLYNRRYFENELERLNQSRKSPISIIVADLDGLKSINDNYGHKKGDNYIKSVGTIIKSISRAEDVLARIGGDEFAVILPDAASRVACDFCNRIGEECEKYNQQKGLNPPINISAGYGVKSSPDDDLEKIFIKADKDMYQIKRKKYCF
ncbi:sensor domain-containing diguanylate cyclase [Halocella sp. SP3-1]|uniref:sensor domain-containing diguanylate cyclase n=1 Tax=Halocella sp. SP3-1 TaxID=2382161 RepID=UPI000F755F57|nr:sensor domain-containing diguanylate cyclase [Halocella sp. SP3-1]AZO94238.1 diguanylate cyclase [Halocella sp. SP3-1]